MAVWHSGNIVSHISEVTVCNQPTSLIPPYIFPGSLNQVPALIGWGKGGIVTFVGWQVAQYDPVCHVSSRNGEACLQAAILC